MVAAVTADMAALLSAELLDLSRRHLTLTGGGVLALLLSGSQVSLASDSRLNSLEPSSSDILVPKDSRRGDDLPKSCGVLPLLASGSAMCAIRTIVALLGFQSNTSMYSGSLNTMPCS